MVGMKGAWEDTVAGLKTYWPPGSTMTNTTMLQNNAPYLATLDFLAEIGADLRVERADLRHNICGPACRKGPGACGWLVTRWNRPVSG